MMMLERPAVRCYTCQGARGGLPEVGQHEQAHRLGSQAIAPEHFTM